MTASVRILTAASLDSNPSLLLVSPNGSKTLVNCGEGCQRSFLESASIAAEAGVGVLKLSSVNRVCLTHLGHDALGGLPGMILTTADAADTVAKAMRGGKAGGAAKDNQQQRNNTDDGRSPESQNDRKRDRSLVSNGEEGMPDLEIIGPAGTKTFLHSLRHFMRRDRFNLCQRQQGQWRAFTAKKKAKKRKFKGSSSNDDIGFNVLSVPVSYDDPDYPENYDEGDDRIQSFPVTKQAVSYLFTTPPLPGKFLIEKAQELNVPKGPMYSQLKAGKSVTFVDPATNEERTVTSEQVVAKGSPGVGVVVVYCPTLAVLKELEGSRSVLDGDATSPEQRVELDVVVHLTPEVVYREPAYQSWCQKFGAAVDHIALHAESTLEGRAATMENSPFVSGMCGGIRRSFVNETLFPMPVIASCQSKECAPPDAHIQAIKGCPMMEYVLMPRSRRGLNQTTVKSLYSTNAVEDLQKNVEQSGAVERASAIVASHATQVDADSNSGLGALIFTGTGSAVPCKHRNVTGKIPAVQQRQRHCSWTWEKGPWDSCCNRGEAPCRPVKTPSTSTNRACGASRPCGSATPHADHHLGLLRLLSERAAICGANDPIVLMAPHDMFDFLAEYRSVAPEIHRSYIAVDCNEMMHGRLHDDLGITLCMSIPVAHCLRSYAVVIDGTSFGRVAYSGDCRPSNRFADVAFGADLLIHEATFEDGMEEDAVLKRHSTVGEAIDVASKMNAKALVLTHFSQRYPKIPQLRQTKEKEKAKEIPIAFAFDFMRLTPSTIGLARDLTPALRLLYPREMEEAEISSEAEKAPASELMKIPGVFAVKGVL
ncbi:hypothetical protein ACHAXT_009882 [Thalassiosira profunda]